MKLLLKILSVVITLTITAVSFSQTAEPLTREEVRAQLVELENAWYHPNRRDPHYPADIQAAEARVVQSESTAQPSTTGVGGANDVASESGRGPSSVGTRSIYFGR
ncbi:MAG: DUF4148 domain-containing protein [Paraburkholderia sp.]